jgi:hypothetical protein
MALSRLLGCVWNLTQLEKTLHMSNWMERRFLYSRRRMARQMWPRSMG